MKKGFFMAHCHSNKDLFEHLVILNENRNFAFVFMQAFKKNYKCINFTTKIKYIYNFVKIFTGKRMA